MIIKILKWIGKFIGIGFVTLAVTLFLLSLFVSNSIDNIDILQDDLVGLVSTDGLADQLGISEEELLLLEQGCEINPGEEACQYLDDPSLLISENTQFTSMIEDIKGYGDYASNLKSGSIILFILGAVLIILSLNLNILKGISTVSLTGGIASLLALFYYKYIPQILDKFVIQGLLSATLKDLPQKMTDNALEILFNWLDLVIRTVTSTALTLTIIFAVIVLVVFIVRRKLKG